MLQRRRKIMGGTEGDGSKWEQWVRKDFTQKEDYERKMRTGSFGKI
jgi:hypothetical protein